MKDYIIEHVKELDGQTNFATTIESVKVFKKQKKQV